MEVRVEKTISFELRNVCDLREREHKDDLFGD